MILVTVWHFVIFIADWIELTKLPSVLSVVGYHFSAGLCDLGAILSLLVHKLTN